MEFRPLQEMIRRAAPVAAIYDTEFLEIASLLLP